MLNYVGDTGPKTLGQVLSGPLSYLVSLYLFYGKVSNKPVITDKLWDQDAPDTALIACPSYLHQVLGSVVSLSTLSHLYQMPICSLDIFFHRLLEQVTDSDHLIAVDWGTMAATTVSHHSCDVTFTDNQNISVYRQIFRNI